MKRMNCGVFVCIGGLFFLSLTELRQLETNFWGAFIEETS